MRHEVGKSHVPVISLETLRFETGAQLIINYCLTAEKLRFLCSRDGCKNETISVIRDHGHCIEQKRWLVRKKSK